jgi:hypothetical protein
MATLLRGCFRGNLSYAGVMRAAAGRVEIRIAKYPKIHIDKQTHLRLFICVAIHHFA